MAQLILSLGSNVGDREENLKQAIRRLKQQFNPNIILSPIYETSPWGPVQQDHFLNLVVIIETQDAPRTCLNICLNIEKDLGRTRVFKNEPRIIDIDILYYDQILIDEPDLKIPHLQIASRKFVLIPLQSLMPHFIDPNQLCSIHELLSKIKHQNDLVNFYKYLEF